MNRFAPMLYDSAAFLRWLPWRATSRLAAWLYAGLGTADDGGLGLLTYHRIAPRVPGLPAPEHNVTPPRFRRQLAGLLRRGFTFWPLQRLLDCHARGAAVPPRTVVVTFDDGYEAVYRHAWPVLRDLGIPATVFICTGYLDTDQPFAFDAWGRTYRAAAPPETYRPLRREQCREMLAGGLIQLGAHTHTHEDFSHRPWAFRQDLQRSVVSLRDEFGVREAPFAFPWGKPEHGHVDDELIAAVRQAGVTCGLTMESVRVAAGSDPFRWGRFNVFNWDTAATLAGKLTGWYSWAPRLRCRLRTLFHWSVPHAARRVMSSGGP